MRAISVPTVAIVGSLDGYLAEFKDMQVIRPSMKLVVVDGATHGGPRGAMVSARLSGDIGFATADG